MPESDRPLPPIGQSKAVGRKQTRLSAVWVVPIVAALVGVWVAVAKIRSEGPTITIVFRSAEGLEAGKTKIHYNGVDVGTLTTVRLSDDHQRVIATAQMAPRTEDFLVAEAPVYDAQHTLYTRLGDWFAFLAAAVGLGLPAAAGLRLLLGRKRRATQGVDKLPGARPE